jgi:hypothetical protein
MMKRDCGCVGVTERLIGKAVCVQFPVTCGFMDSLASIASRECV